MRIGARLVAAALGCVLALGVAASPSTAAASRHQPCAAGASPAASERVEASVVGAANTRFQRTLSHRSAAAKRSAGRLFVTDLEAYLYGYPIVMMRRTVQRFPRNLMVSIGALAGPQTRTVVAPNDDTLYSVAQVDLSDGPIVIHAPPTAGRYSVLQLLDGFTDVAAYLGDGASARTGQTAVLVPPGWHGSLPAGLRVIRPATSLLWLLGRTLAGNARDTAAAVGLLGKYSLTPLAAYEAGQRTPPLILHSFPAQRPVHAPSGVAFFDELGADLTADPPPGRDACAIRAFARAGVPTSDSATTPTGTRARALKAAAGAGPKVLGQLVDQLRRARPKRDDGWGTIARDAGRFGLDYLDRAVVARVGLGANTESLALYLADDRDAAGRPLDGSHTYTVRFAPGRLPPARAFWSLTLYNRQILLHRNPLDRYSVGNRTAGLRRGRDGALTITISHRPPPRGRRSNWLPAPDGPFSLYLRLYRPTAAALNGSWRPPAVVRSR